MAAAQWATKLIRPVIRRGLATARHVPLTTSWLLRRRPNQGRRTLCEVMTRVKSNSRERLVLQTLAGTYPGNALLYKWGLTPSPGCSLCGHPLETKAHIQCVCPTLKAERIRVHHGLGAPVGLHRKGVPGGPSIGKPQ